MNYKHLQYFLEVAERGSVAAASRRLHLTPQTISGQIKLLEEDLGGALFQRNGRRLELTPFGHLAHGFAREIFSLGAEMRAVLAKGPPSPRLEFRIGVADVVPKAVAYRLIEPALTAVPNVHLVFREWRLESLVTELALHRVDMVLADTARPPQAGGVRPRSQRLGASGLSFFAAPALRERHRGTFPTCLDGAPLLAPPQDSALGGQLQSWLQGHGIRPTVVGEFDDSAMAEEFGRRGVGFFVGPSVLALDIRRRLGVQQVGSAEDIQQQFHALTARRREPHPCVVAITASARDSVFRQNG